MTKADYIQLTNGQKVRFEINMNSLSDFVAQTGIELHNLDGMGKDLKAVRSLALSAAKEGEAIDGREFLMTDQDIGRLMRVAQITEFIKILTRQAKAMKAE